MIWRKMLGLLSSTDFTLRAAERGKPDIWQVNWGADSSSQIYTAAGTDRGDS